MANAEALTSKINCLRGSGRYRTGSLRVILINLSTAWVCVSVHRKAAPFFRRLVSGRFCDGCVIGWLGGGCLCFGVGGGFVGLLRTFPGHVALDLAVEASSFFLQLLLMLSKGSSGLSRIYFHGDGVVPLFPFYGRLPLLFSVLSLLWGPGKSQVLLNCISLVFFSGHCLPLVDGFWPFQSVHASLGQSIWEALTE